MNKHFIKIVFRQYLKNISKHLDFPDFGIKIVVVVFQWSLLQKTYKNTQENTIFKIIKNDQKLPPQFVLRLSAFFNGRPK